HAINGSMLSLYMRHGISGYPGTGQRFNTVAGCRAIIVGTAFTADVVQCGSFVGNIALGTKYISVEVDVINDNLACAVSFVLKQIVITAKGITCAINSAKRVQAVFCRIGRTRVAGNIVNFFHYLLLIVIIKAG